MKTWLAPALLIAALVLALGGCFYSEPDLGRMHFWCQFDTDCLDGYVCRQHPEGKYCTPASEFVPSSQDDASVGEDAAPEGSADAL